MNVSFLQIVSSLFLECFLLENDVTNLAPKIQKIAIANIMYLFGRAFCGDPKLMFVWKYDHSLQRCSDSK
jgi:hypothetical protein